VITHDSHNDLALLKGNFKPSTVLPLSRDNPPLLQAIYVAGFPFGQKISSSIKVTRGIVSSLTGIGNNVSEIQIDAALQPGNSGGPIIDGNGNVVAVAVAKLNLMTAVENWGVVPENTNFGVKSTVVVNLLQSNNVKLRAPNTKTVSKTTLGKSMSDATYYLSCWMTMAQIEKLRTEKVMFSSFD
jgi:serine protease Do